MTEGSIVIGAPHRGATAWTCCASCHRIWRAAQLHRVRTATGWCMRCPDWECDGAGDDPLPFPDGLPRAAELVPGQRLADLAAATRASTPRWSQHPLNTG